MTTAERFWQLFRGRDDVYAINHPTKGMLQVKEPVTMEVVERHLTGDQPIGIYPLVHFRGESWVCWGCSDIDIDDESLAWRLHDTLLAANITSWVERSRSKGFHVWAFVEQPLLAREMRNAFLAAHKVAGIPAVEVNPKQVDVAGKGYGNLVRLPYPSGYSGRQVMLMTAGASGWWTLTGFLAQPTVYAKPEAIQRAASVWKEPVRHVVATQTIPSGAAYRRASALVKHIWKNGPLEGKDRSTTMAHMAHQCAADGQSASDCYALLASWAYNKFHDRPDEADQLQKIIERAYG